MTRAGGREPPWLPSRAPLGHLAEWRRDPLGLLARGFAEHGDAFAFRLGAVHRYALRHPRAVQQVLVDQRQAFGRDNLGFRRLREVAGRGLLTSEGDTWRTQRRLMQPLFHRPRLDELVPTMARVARDQAEELAARLGPGGGPLELVPALSRLALAVVCETLLGGGAPEDSRALYEAVSANQRHVRARMLAPLALPRAVPTPATRAFFASLDALRAEVTARIAERRGRPDPPDDLLTRLVAAADAGGMDEALLRDEVLTIFVAGHETTAYALAFTLWLLATHPEAEAAVRAEVDEVLAGRSPTAADLPRLPRCARAFHEALRLYPPAWVLVRDVREDVVVDGVRLPAGAGVYLPAYATHRHPEAWDDPAAFRPERFAPDAVEARHPYAWFPFGGGPRRCLGLDFATKEAVVVLATWLPRLRLEPTPGQALALEPNLTLRPAGELPLRAIPRQRSATLGP